MSQGGEEITVDTLFDNLPKAEVTDLAWTVSLGTDEWPRSILMLKLFEEDDTGESEWVVYGRIDALRRNVSSLSRPVLVMTSSTDSTDIFELDPRKFSAKHTQCHVPDDIGAIIAKLRAAGKKNDWTTVNFFVIMGCSRFNVAKLE